MESRIFERKFEKKLSVDHRIQMCMKERAFWHLQRNEQASSEKFTVYAINAYLAEDLEYLGADDNTLAWEAFISHIPTFKCDPDTRQSKIPSRERDEELMHAPLSIL